MKYFNIPAINKTITIIREENITLEHRPASAITSLIRNYFPVDKFVLTPEMTQTISGKRPDLSIEKYNAGSDTCSPYCFVEIKSIVNSSINKTVEQLHDTVFMDIDAYGNLSGKFSVYMIAIKGTFIGFYAYHNFSSLLDEYGIENYKGFVPLTYMISWKKYKGINESIAPIVEEAYELYQRRVNFPTDSATLRQLGVESSEHIRHLYLFDLLNPSHQEHIHNIFQCIVAMDPNLFVVS